jgi:hypothetical protein
MSIFSGLDPREYSYSYFDVTLPDGNAMNIRCENVWLVHRVQAYAAAVAGTVQLEAFGSGSIPVAAGGCLLLEPNGLYRRNIIVRGLGMLVVVEYFYQATPTGIAPTILSGP